MSSVFGELLYAIVLAGMLESYIFGDIRIIRRSIIHNSSIVIEDLKKLKFLKWFKKGYKIEIETKQLEKIIECIFYSVLNDISGEYKKYGPDLFKQSKISKLAQY